MRGVSTYFARRFYLLCIATYFARRFYLLCVSTYFARHLYLLCRSVSTYFARRFYLLCVSTLRGVSTYFARRFPREVAVGCVLEVAVVARLVVLDVHLAVAVHPQAAHDDVVHRRRHLAPRVVVAAPVK